MSEYDVNKINFIQIGANVGDAVNDIMFKLVREHDWVGIFVEPIPPTFKQLIENYKDLEGCHFEQSAITNKDGEIIMYYRGDGLYNRQQASINKAHWSNDVNIKVPCLTLISLVEKYGMTNEVFEFLQIDAEGVDDVIILSTDFNIVRPEKIRFENVHMKGDNYTKVMKHLKSFGYEEIEDELIDLMPENRQEIERKINTVVQKVKQSE